MIDRIIFSVYQINKYVKETLDYDPILQNIWIRGEISNFKWHSSGHMYFTLKDKSAKVRCVMFKQKNHTLDFIPHDGMAVILLGKISLYSQEGQYQVYVDYMEQDGLGKLYAEFLKLKDRLQKEGLFDTKLKKQIPFFPTKVAIVTSHTGAAVQDIIDVMHRRCPMTDIFVVPVLVQGKNASKQIAAALDYINTRSDIDVIILARGGGSIEELWAFNEEQTAYAIYHSHIPVISGIGHETDFTIADFVSDLRAPTPSAAAEIAVPDLNNIMDQMENLTFRAIKAISRDIDDKRQYIDTFLNNYIIKYPQRFVDQRYMQVDFLYSQLYSFINTILSNKKHKLSSIAGALEALSPLSILARGYAQINKIGYNNNPICSIKQLHSGDNVQLCLHDGKAICYIDKIMGG